MQNNYSREEEKPQIMLYLKSNVVKQKILRALTYTHTTHRQTESPGKHRKTDIQTKVTKSDTERATI